jgi:hypothetical protein
LGTPPNLIDLAGLAAGFVEVLFVEAAGFFEVTGFDLAIIICFELIYG